ncbi:unnamed protein product [Adineta steineri]|uniref:Uncharacterized protein n=1 Tax=Adineta steineri TaxID=433720 RepID=A0A815VM31_9BILA|nr:unnamed protein product [Adineta steineri]CAF1537520.1 unnamed protein product [Adineta steineri]
MSLADALTKHIVSFLLEDIGTCSSSGLVSLVFTDKLYLDFRRMNANVQDSHIRTYKQLKKLFARYATTPNDNSANREL